mmetsp:Transcript_51332/g.123915  ORF Transcript_51332/g.123915 Transcript_51332/m.123915 type:complete len:344 (-) Transcript_51332:79-1110(-)
MAPTTKNKTSAAPRSYSGGSAKHKMKTKTKKVPKRHQSPETRRRRNSGSSADPSTYVGKSFAQWWEEIPTKKGQRKYERLCFGTITAYVTKKKKKKKSCKPFYEVEFDDGDKYQLYEENFDAEENLRLYHQYKSTRNKSAVARDFETKEPIQFQSARKDDHDKNLIHTTYVRRVDGEEEEEEEDNDEEDDDKDIPEAEAEAEAEGVIEDTNDDDAEEGAPCCVECAVKDERIEQLELENEDSDKAHARDNTKWTATENEYKRKLDAASEQHASDQRNIEKLTKELDEAMKERDNYKNERDEVTKERDEYMARMKGIQRLASSPSSSSSSSSPSFPVWSLLEDD